MCSVDQKMGGFEHRESAVTFRDRLERLNLAAEVHDVEPTEALRGKTVLRLDVTDAERWSSKENAEQLLPYFGQIAYQAYAERDDKRPFNLDDPEMRAEAFDHIYDADLTCARSVYVVAEGERPLGFLTLEDLSSEAGRQAGLVGLVATDREARNQGIAKELYRYVFNSGEFDEVASVSSTPALVKVQLEIGRQCGYTGFYCGFREGKYGDRGSPDQQQAVDRLTDLVTNDYVEDEVAIPAAQLPKHFIVMREGCGLPPITARDVRFSDKDAELRETFERAVLPTQAEHLPRTVYGIVLNVRERPDVNS